MSLLAYTVPRASFPALPRAACRAFLEEAAGKRGYTLREMQSRNRTQRVGEIRQRVMAEAYATGKWSLLTIGHCIGRHHTTVLFAVAKYRALAQQERAA